MIVKFFVPLSRSAAIKFSGIPENSDDVDDAEVGAQRIARGEHRQAPGDPELAQDGFEIRQVAVPGFLRVRLQPLERPEVGGADLHHVVDRAAQEDIEVLVDGRAHDGAAEVGVVGLQIRTSPRE